MPDQLFWIEQYKKMGALWIHDGNPKRPHALLTSGNHSNGFFNSELVMEDPMILAMAVNDLLHKVLEEGLFTSSINRVVGPAMGAITLAHEAARQIADRFNAHCLRAYTEKVEDGGKKKMVFGRTKIKEGERILLVEDVLTTGDSVIMASNAVSDAGGIVLPYIAVLVNRSGLTEVDGKRIVSLINEPMPMWTPEECPLCKDGSEAIRPKGADNWKRLNAKY